MPAEVCLRRNATLNHLCIICLVFQVSCISPVDLEPEEPDNLLVVEGSITTEPGPHIINVSRLSRFADISRGGTIVAEDRAAVFIIDDLGNRVDLQRRDVLRKEVRNLQPEFCDPGAGFIEVTTFGYHTPDDFSAQVGRTYTLNVNTRNGRRYVSTPQTVIPTPEIDSLSLRFVRLPSTDPITFGTGVEVYSTWQDPAEQANFYSWRINGIYRIETPNNPSVRCCLFDPADNGATLCWIRETNIFGNEIAFDDTQVNGERITQRIGFIEDNGVRFSSRDGPESRQYYVEVHQIALSPEAFAFNRLFATQLEIDGDLFDPPPATLRGNMSNANDPDEEVIGFFGAFSVQEESIFIERSLLEVIQRSPGLCGDCRVRAGATVEIPEPFR